MKRLILSSLLASALALLGMNRAEAGFSVVFLPPATGAGPNFTYTYRVSITAEDSIISGNFFRIYDFGGYVPGSITAPAGWVASTALVNPTPPPNVVLTHGDDPAISNLIFTYTGATTIVGPATSTGFSADSTIQTGVNGILIAKDYVGRAIQTVSGEFVDSVGNVAVPAVPEPSSCVLLGLGGVGVVGLLARRRARKV